MYITKSINRTLAVPLTTIEKVDMGHRLAELYGEYGDAELRKKASADRFKEELEELDGRIAHLARIVRSGEEYRTVECKWRYLFDVNTKELVRMDTGEIVETAAITAEERQLMLQIDQEKEAEAAAEKDVAKP